MANADARQWAGIITVGTPHTGAPLAANTLNGQVFEEGRYIATTVAEPFLTYYRFYPDDWAWSVAGAFGHFAASIGDVMPYLSAAVGFGAQYSVLPEMAPGSPFLNGTLNTGANINREAAALPQRISIVSSVNDSWGNFFHGVLPGSYRSLAAAQYAAGAAFYFAGEYYANFDDYNDPYWYDKQANAFLWYDAAASMFFLDQNWCALIGAADGYYQCTPNDGILPTGVQVYPNSSLSVPIFGPSHQEETSDNQVYSNLGHALTQRFGVGGGGGGVITGVSISGPSTVNLCGGSWFASPAGGVAPYTYTWTAGGSSYDTGSSNELDYSPARYGSIGVSVTATDSQGHRGSGSKNVNVSSQGAC